MKTTIFKIRPKDDGSFRICCPSCDNFWNLSTNKLKGHGNQGQQVFKLRCTCACSFFVHLELRRIRRQETLLTGYFERYISKGGGVVCLTSEKIKPNCKINNVTREGIGITTLSPHQLLENDTIVIRFTLDNANYSEITKKAIVKRVVGSYLGCEFVEPYEEHKDFNFYLFNK